MCVFLSVRVCYVGTAVDWKLWLVLQSSTTQRALMCNASRRRHLIIHCTDRVRAKREGEDRVGRRERRTHIVGQSHNSEPK